MNCFLKPFVEDMNHLSSAGFAWTDPSGNTRHTRVFPGPCSVDTVARAMVMNMTQFNGAHGCAWCEHMVGGAKTEKIERAYLDIAREIARSNVEEMTRDWESKVESLAGELRQKREQRAEVERQAEELRQEKEWKAELEEHKKKCEDMVQQLTGVVNKEKEEVAEKTAVGAADLGGQFTGDKVVVSIRKEVTQLYSAAVQQGPRKVAEVEAHKAQIAGGSENRQSGVKRVLVVGDSNMGVCDESIRIARCGIDNLRASPMFERLHVQPCNLSFAVRHLSRHMVSSEVSTDVTEGAPGLK
ncbi:hypothetical protein HPB47_012807 [Ixodes persulcatus]|uniref:Uncharacterized protein n=1 Tax=Ixodes persulcatus TaxID=34615 RepID=A0AC60NSI6_IXOPE|nr:hypothetical protein HPB47_012807 [Ixodes persulcatus]